jgi:hypothetical protein
VNSTAPGPWGSVDVEAPVGRGHVSHAVVDDRVEPGVGEYRAGELGKVLAGERDHRRIDLDLGEPLDRVMLERLFGDAAVAATDDQHLARSPMGEDRHVAHHLVIDELIAGGDLRCPVEHEDTAEVRVLEQHEMLVLGARLMQHPRHLEARLESERLEQGFEDPALRGHGISGKPVTGADAALVLTCSGRFRLMRPARATARSRRPASP